jgi:hypothetical protein
MHWTRRIAAGGALAACTTLATGAAADRVVVKGVALEGTVKSITADAVVMETIYGKGELSIAVADVESIETETPFHVLYGDDVRTTGRVVGVTSEVIRVEDGGSPVEVAFAEVHVTRRDPGPEANWLRRVPVEHPYWSGNFDLSFAATQATDDTLSLATALGIVRERRPHHTRMGVTYLLGWQKSQGESSDTTANELRGFLRHEYDFAKRWFLFGAVDGEYDEIEHLSLRSVPKLGVGYRILEREHAWLTVDASGAYVFERFFGGETNHYPGLGLGAEWNWKLPFNDAVWHSRLDYTPSFEDFLGDYLLRFETSLLIPMWQALSFKLSLVDVYDSTPAEDADENTLSTLLGLSYGF